MQPWPDRAFISIRADSTWSTETHLRFEYAVLLVDPEYHPLPTLDVAPTQGGPVALVKSVKEPERRNSPQQDPLSSAGTTACPCSKAGKWKAWGCRMSWVKKKPSAFRIIIRRYMPHHRGSTWPASLPAASGIAFVARMNVARGRRQGVLR
jgi:hypothetical protein